MMMAAAAAYASRLILDSCEWGERVAVRSVAGAGHCVW
ncbi:hypothetical protein MPTA5024_27040 [Microbispora sp. ATCC PTA-5024]|nr:hypothetical protein MPTA5024_27040 [Microbispora sp. ATCC PTA-5024]